MFLVRHGQTEWNAIGRMQGQLDSSLTDKGKAQARAMGEALQRDFPGQIKRVFCSPLGRTRQTAELICAEIGFDPAQMEIHPLLIEVNWGEWSGFKKDDIARREPKKWAEMMADRWNLGPPGGESFADLWRRAETWFNETNPGEDVLAVSHGAFGAAMRGYYGKLAPQELVKLDEPQDAYFRFVDETVLRYDTFFRD